MKPRCSVEQHTQAVELLAQHPEVIGIDKRKLVWILKEPILFKQGTSQYDSCADVIYGYENPDRSLPVEIKNDASYPNQKAKYQLENTCHVFCDRLGYPALETYIVYYPSMRIEKLKVTGRKA